MRSIRFLIVGSLFLFVTLICSPAYSQQPTGPTPEQLQLQQEMKSTFSTIMQNMQEKGIDARQIFQQMQEGTDPAEIQKQLIDQGVIDQKTVDQLQITTQKVMALTLKDRLKVSDADWAILEPLIQKVQAAAAAVGQPGTDIVPMGAFMSVQSSTSLEISKAKKALDAAVKDPTTTPEQFREALKALRDARAKAGAELTAAQQALVSALTIRQEGLLIILGLLE